MPKRRRNGRRRSEMDPRARPVHANWTRPARLLIVLILWAQLAALSFIKHLLLSLKKSLEMEVEMDFPGGNPNDRTHRRRRRTPVLLIIVLGRAEKGLIMLCTTVLRSAASAVAHLSRLVSIFGCLCLPLSLSLEQGDCGHDVVCPSGGA